MWTTIFKITKVPIIVTWGGGKGSLPPPPSIFLLKNISFLATELKRGRVKELGKSGEEGCMYIKDWFKQIFPPFSNLIAS